MRGLHQVWGSLSNPEGINSGWEQSLGCHLVMLMAKRGTSLLSQGVALKNPSNVGVYVIQLYTNIISGVVGSRYLCSLIPIHFQVGLCHTEAGFVSLRTFPQNLTWQNPFLKQQKCANTNWCSGCYSTCLKFALLTSRIQFFLIVWIFFRV